MEKKGSILTATVVLGLLLTGCAATGPAPDAAQKEVVIPAAEARQDSCAKVIEQAVEQARTTRRTVKKTCDDRKIEATPMWSLDYNGTVHLVVRDATGAVTLDEYRKP